MDPFWQSKHLNQLTPDEWESLCDGCGRCCLSKLEDADSGEIFYTDVACRMLDLDSCRCRDYAHRHDIVADCVRVDREHLEELRWMPESCAYRLVYEGRPLPDWHPLISGDRESVHAAGISIKGRAVSEVYVHADDLTERLVSWVSARRNE